MPTDDTAVLPPGDRDERRDRRDEDVDREQRPEVDRAAERRDARVHDRGVHQRVDRVAAEQERDPPRRADRGPHRGRRALDRRHDQLPDLRDADDDPDRDRDDDDRDQDDLDDAARRDLLGLERVGESATAKTSRITCATMLPDVDEQPPGRDRRGEVDALPLEEADLRRHPADRRHREVRERHRQLQLAVRRAASGIGTVPISAIAVAKLVANEMNIATASHPSRRS